MNGRTSRGVLCACVVFALVACGCDSKPTHESVTKERIDKVQELADVLKTIKDEASFEAAKPKLEKLKKEVDELKKKTDALGKPPPEVVKKLEEKYQKDLEKAQGELLAQMMRIGADPKIAPRLKDAMPQ